MVNVKINFYIILLLIVLNCKNENKKGDLKKDNIVMEKDDVFYKSKKTEDLSRIPLLKPYELQSVGGVGYGWFFELPFQNIPSLVSNQIDVDEVSIHKNFIILYSKRIYVEYNMQEAWFVIDVNKEKEFLFTQESKMFQFLEKKGIENFNFYDPDTLYRYFVLHDTLLFKTSSKN